MMVDVHLVMVVLRNSRDTHTKAVPPPRRAAKTPTVKKSRPRAARKKPAPKKKGKAKQTPFARPDSPWIDGDLIEVQRVSCTGWLTWHVAQLT